MKISRIRVKKFGPFGDTGWLEFATGINILVGQNNSGKSALLRALDFPLRDDRHRNANEYRLERLETPTVEFDLTTSGQDIESAILKRRLTLNWPLAEQISHEDSKLLMAAVFLEPVLNWEMVRSPSQHFQTRRTPSHGRFNVSSPWFAGVAVGDGKAIFQGVNPNAPDNVSQALDQIWETNFFSFNAQRYSIGRSSFGREERLRSDAGNLAAVLCKLQGEQGSLFARLVDHVREIFSTVQNLSVAPTPDGFEIRVWPTEEQSQPELGFALDNCGTGIAQVIAILTVAMTFEKAVIAIDEISSFLHPAAAKALLRIMQTKYAKHQYIISTHSPEVLSAANAASVHVVRKTGYESSVQKVDLANLEQLRDVANDLGISMADVFASDRIVWVEGKTEELCFPFIYAETTGRPLSGISVNAIVATGDLNSKKTRRELIFHIYERLSKAASPLVDSVSFGFDREVLSDAQMNDLKKSATGNLLFLPRRHFECYLLNPSAIAALINHNVGGSESLSPEEILAGLKEIGGAVKFGASSQWDGDIQNEAWLTIVDAASLLKDLFNRLTGSRLVYHKTSHSLELLKHALLDNPKSLAGLVDYVKKLFDSVGQNRE